MGQDLVNKAEKNNNWPHIPTKTKHLKIHGYKENVNLEDPLYFYGSDEEPLLELSKQNGWSKSIGDSMGVIEAQVVWAVRNEMALNVEDFLARRVRCQLLNAKESVRMAPKVAEIMAKELGKDKNWETKEVADYLKVTSNYILN